VSALAGNSSTCLRQTYLAPTSEILRREIGDDLAIAKLVGVVAVGRRWCYRDWQRLLAAEPAHMRRAVEIFGAYPESGVLAAIEAGWDGDGLP
jgi:hypothetical protein